MQCESCLELDIHFCRLSYLPLTLLVHVPMYPPPPPHTHTFCFVSHVILHVVISCYCNFLFPYGHLKCIPCLTYVPSVDGKMSLNKKVFLLWLFFLFHRLIFISGGLILLTFPSFETDFLLFVEWFNIYNEIQCVKKKNIPILWAYLVGSDNSY
jgi:hypothetical protein